MSSRSSFRAAAADSEGVVADVGWVGGFGRMVFDFSSEDGIEVASDYWMIVVCLDCRL